jgi:hypothetical protein
MENETIIQKAWVWIKRIFWIIVIAIYTGGNLHKP